jgi:hypothetical protein
METTETTEAAATNSAATATTTEAAAVVAAAAPLLGAATATTTEATPASTTEAAEPTESAEAKPQVKPEGAPEAYAFVAPEGKAYDPNILTAFEASAKEANLTQEAAQKLLDTMSPKIAERQQEQVLAINKEWLETSKADKEYGGDALDVNLGIAKKALDKFGTPELAKLLGTTGLGNHPEIIRAFYRAGKAISEDTFVGGAAPAGKTTNAAAILYDNTK